MSLECCPPLEASGRSPDLHITKGCGPPAPELTHLRPDFAHPRSVCSVVYLVLSTSHPPNAFGLQSPQCESVKTVSNGFEYVAASAVKLLARPAVGWLHFHPHVKSVTCNEWPPSRAPRHLSS